MLDRRLDQRHQLLLVAGERARDERGAELQRHGHEVDRIVGIGHAALGLRAAVGGGGELALGEAVHAVVLDDVDHVDAAAQRMRELAEPDRGRIAVARDAEIDEVAVGEVGAGEHRWHAPVHRVEAVRVAEEIGRRLRRAADAGELGHPMRRDVELEAGLDDRARDRVVAAAGAQRRDRTLVVAMGVAERVLRQRRMVELGLGDVGHGRHSHDTTLRSGVTLRRIEMLADRARDEARGDRRAVVVQDRHQADRIDAAFVDDQRAQLGVAVLLDHEHEVVVGDEAGHAGVEREGAHAQPVERVAAGLDQVDRLVHRRRGRAVIDHAVFGRLVGIGLQRARHQVLGGLELAHQPLHVVGIGRAFLGVARVAVARGAAGEERALARMGAGIGAVRDAVAVDVEIAAEILAGVEIGRRHHLAAVVFAAVVPVQRRGTGDGSCRCRDRA